MSDVFNDEFKRLIAGRAHTILERVENPNDFENALREESTAAEAFEEWEDVFPEDSLDYRLEQDDLTRDDFRRAAEVDKLADDVPLPEWIHSLDDIVESVLDKDPAEFRPSADDRSEEESSGEPPFTELLTAVAATAREGLPEDPVEETLTDQAIRTMMDWFEVRFRRRFVRILFVEFKTFVASKDRDLAFADPDDFDELPTEHYEEFIDYLFAGGFAELCQEYPVFGRLLVCQVRQWREHFHEFASRLRADREALGRRFTEDGDIGAVRELEPLADDTHGDGRAIMRVAFESGVTVVYKPRSVEAGETFYDVLSRLNDYLDIPEFKTPTYLSRDDYGWMEWVDHAECADAEAVERYYRRAGSLVCLTYLLHFTDCQYENLIVSGEHPVLVDAETVCAPHFHTNKRPHPTGTGVLMNRSVLLSLLLPMGSSDDDGLSDIGEATSGLSVSAEEKELSELTNSIVTAVNTDLMAVEHVPSQFDRSENVPSVDGDPHLPDEYLAEIIDGFRTTYETVVELRDRGELSAVGLPDAFESIENRIVWRPTMRYAARIDAMSARSCLHDGSWFGAEIERLSLPFFDGKINDDDIWPFYEAERRKMRQLEPPRFSCRTDETAIQLNGVDIGVNADVAGLTISRNRIESADREDMLEQIEFIRGAFEATPDPEKPEYNDITSERQHVSDERLREEAERLFESVKSATVQLESGQRHMSSVVPRSESLRLSLQPGDHSLYIGRTGVALLGAALYNLTGEEQYQTFVQNTLQATRKAIRAEYVSPVQYRHGGTTGFGAVAYALAVTGELLDDETLLEDAARTAKFVNDETLEGDATYDVSSGSAGTILGLLAVNDRYESDEVVSAAKKCGDYLLANRTETADGLRTWETLEDAPPLTGFAHGASGIAYALIRLADVTGEAKYREAAYTALEFESQKYAEEENNWPDERGWVDDQFHDQWCYGRSGTGLTRLGMSEYVDDNRVTRGLERALEGVPTQGLKDFDHVCCGEAGRSEFLLEAERQRDECVGMARELLGGVIDRKERSGTYRTMDETNRITNPTFFHGVSGIAYSMLRVIDSESLPSVLLWE